MAGEPQGFRDEDKYKPAVLRIRSRKKAKLAAAACQRRQPEQTAGAVSVDTVRSEDAAATALEDARW